MEPDTYEKMYNAWLDATKKFLSPWSSMMPGQQANPFQMPFVFPQSQQQQMPDFSKEWTRMMEKMFAFPSSMMIQGVGGPGATLQKDYWELMNESLDLYKEWVDVSMAFSKVWLQTSSSVFERFSALAAKSATMKPEDLTKQTYDLWVEEAEGKMDSLLRDNEFSQKLASLLSKYLDVKKKTDSIAEKYYVMMNIPTRSEIDNLYKELHELRKKVSHLSSMDKKKKEE